MDGTFTNLFLYPIKFHEYFIAKALQIIIESYIVSLIQIFFFSLLGIHITDLTHFLLILAINDVVSANMGVLFLCLSMQFQKLGSINSLAQQIIGFLSGYSTDIKRYPDIIRFISYVIPLTYTIALSRNDVSSFNLLWLIIPIILSFLLTIIGYCRINRDIEILRKKRDVDQ